MVVVLACIGIAVAILAMLTKLTTLLFENCKVMIKIGFSNSKVIKFCKHCYYCKLDHFYLFEPWIKPKIRPLIFPSITTKRYVVDRSNYTFSESYNKRNLLVMVGLWFSSTLKQLLNSTPVQTILKHPGFLYRMWPGSNMKWWSSDPYQHNEIIKPFVSFQLSKLS